MAVEKRLWDETYSAGADLSAKQYFIVAQSAADTVILAAAVSDHLKGVLQNKPGNGEAASVRKLGLSKVVSGAAITPGTHQFLTTDASGRAVPVASAGDIVFAEVRGTATAADQYVTCELIGTFEFHG